jgi:hypothetical protein
MAASALAYAITPAPSGEYALRRAVNPLENWFCVCNNCLAVSPPFEGVAKMRTAYVRENLKGW